MKAKGYILRLEPARHVILSRLSGEKFAEPVPYFDHSRNSVLICFITTESSLLTHIGLARRGMSAGTGLSRLNIYEILTLKESLNLSQILNEIENKDRSRTEKYLNVKGLIPPATFAKIVDVVKNLAPSTKGLLGRYGERRNALIAKLTIDVKAKLAEQKETLATALNIAGIDRKPLYEWEIESEGNPSSFLQGLSSARLREDTMVINDFRKFPGYKYISELPYNAAIFQNQTTRLTTILANRTPLEELLGTDLIYYNEKYSSFIFVQYKALEYTGGDRGFRIPNEQLDLEIERMKRILGVIKSFPKESEIIQYRLSSNPFFLKFCSRMVFDPDSTTLISGMYIPLDMWDDLVSSEKIKGSRGGKVISYSTVDRYFDNTEFASIVNKAWVGTFGKQSRLLEQIIRESIEAGRAVTIAIKSDIPIEEQKFPEKDYGVFNNPFLEITE